MKKLLGLFRRPEPAVKAIDHQSLGHVVWEREDWWKGSFSFEGNTIEFFLAGHDQPDPVCTAACLEAIASFSLIRDRVSAFIAQEIPKHGYLQLDLSVDDFVIESINFMWPNKPDYCMILFDNAKDEYGMWNCELIKGEPKHLNRDD